MTPVLSPNTQAILLLTAPLINGRGPSSPDLLAPGEYKSLARHLREIQRQPSDLVSAEDAVDILRACHPVIDESRLQRLLGRGFLLAQVIERWQARAIWVVSRADADYPRRLKVRLREDAPAVLYGCGDIRLLETGGLAVVGSRNVDDPLIDYTISIGQITGRAGRTLVSGGARGIDQAAMRGALEVGGKVCGVLADSLEKTTMNREHRNMLLDGQLTLISPYDPSAGFNVGHAMQRNKVVYALADVSLVVSSDVNKGGTWAGAVEQLEKFRFIPVYVRSTGESSIGLDALRKKGALAWPNPEDAKSIESVFNATTTAPTTSPQIGPAMLAGETIANARHTISEPHQTANIFQSKTDSTAEVDFISEVRFPPAASRSSALTTQSSESAISNTEANIVAKLESTPAELLFKAVRNSIQQLLSLPMKDTEVAAALNVSNAQAKVWLHRLVDEGILEKQTKPAGYVIKQTRLFE